MAMASVNPATNALPSAMNLLRNTTRVGRNRALALAVAPSCSAPGSNVSYATSTSGGESEASGHESGRIRESLLPTFEPPPPLTAHLYGCVAGNLGSHTVKAPSVNFAASVDGYSETFATRWETRASATHPGFTRAFFPKSAPFECDTSSKSGSSASSRRSARRSVSTRALTRMATRDLPLSTATTSPGECTSKPSRFNSWFNPLDDSSFPRSSPFPSLFGTFRFISAGRAANAAREGRRTATDSGPSAA